MTKNQELDNATSCLSRSQGDEPIFVLCARDEIAPFTVRDWVERAEMRGVNAEKIADAIRLAEQMEQWQRDHGKKLPD